MTLPSCTLPPPYKERGRAWQAGVLWRLPTSITLRFYRAHVGLVIGEYPGRLVPGSLVCKYQLFVPFVWECQLLGGPGPRKGAEKPPVPGEAEPGGSPSCWKKGAPRSRLAP